MTQDETKLVNQLYAEHPELLQLCPEEAHAWLTAMREDLDAKARENRAAK